ncbi:uncharacterized protein EV154DRAFT_506774 [Mucor mucedo]|uniref:uncharacterized protein n=1 Tax=Mucor mucedo TaxID=29922 RepID=UPI00221E6A84|nr:uncharacterized protein EV154DRAFT_506774 [Mucor mucedo]KAI7891877.1 hypothetical protein EV154DRAFT_506774 [Mucor mucedo]
MNPNASEHNHEMMSPEEMVKAWPIEVNEMIIQLARQRLQTHEIREAVKQQFPEISWNERRFYNRLTEERKRIRQRGVVERSQRLLMLSARLCSVIASNEEWAHCVESDLQRMFENFCQLARLTPENINTLVDLQADMIQIDTDRLISNTHRLSIEDEFMGSPAKKRRSFAKGNNDTLVIQKSPSTSGNTTDTQKGIQMVYVPSYTIQVRSSLNRSLSESSNHSSSRRVFNNNEFENQPFASSSSFFSLASPTSSSSSSSSMPLLRQQQQQQQQQHGMGRPVSSPMNSPSEFIMSQTYQTPQPQNEDYTSTSNGNYPFSPYTIPTSAFTSPPELPFAFEPTMMRNNEAESSNTAAAAAAAAAAEDRRVFGFFPNTVKEEPSHVEQQHMLQRQQQEYEQRMHRSFTQGTGTAANYVLPMIRSNQDPDESAHWT